MNLSHFRPNWIGAFGEKYYRKDFLHIGFQDDDLPLFAKIVDILVIASITLFYVELYQTIGINGHLSAYAIVCTPQKDLMLLPQLQNKV